MKHILNPKGTKHTILGALLEVEVLKKCTPLSHKALLEAKSVKTKGLGAFLKLGYGFAWQGQGIPGFPKSEQDWKVV